MQILQLVKWLSARQNNGGEMRSISLGQLLAQFAAVDVIGFRAADDTLPLESAAALAHYRDMYPVELDGRWRRGAWTLANLGRGYSLRSSRFRSPAYCRQVAELLRSRRYDAVQVEELSLLQTVGPLPGVAVVYSSHNVESVLAPRILRARAGGYGAWFDRGRTAAEERRAVEQSSLCLAVSAADQRLLEDLAPRRAGAVHVIPNCVGDDVVPAADALTTGGAVAEVVCVASFGWYPNVQGARWLLEAVVPQLRRQGAACAIRFVGSRIDAALAEQIVAAGCVYSADVPATLPFLHRARAAVVPLLIGGGTRIKVVEAWAAGVPVVSTRAGAEGLDCADGDDALLADDAASFAAALCRVLEDDALYRRLRANGLRRAADLRWSRVAPRLERLYAELMRGGAEATA